MSSLRGYQSDPGRVLEAWLSLSAFGHLVGVAICFAIISTLTLFHSSAVEDERLPLHRELGRNILFTVIIYFVLLFFAYLIMGIG